MEGFIVQWYDKGYDRWRSHGRYEVSLEEARKTANELFKNTRGMVDVRVRYEETKYLARKLSHMEV